MKNLLLLSISFCFLVSSLSFANPHRSVEKVKYPLGTVQLEKKSKDQTKGKLILVKDKAKDKTKVKNKVKSKTSY